VSSRVDADVTLGGHTARDWHWRSRACSALCAVAVSTFSLAAAAQGDPERAAQAGAVRNFPKKLTITVVADERLLVTFQERVSSWFNDGTEVRVAATREVDEQELLSSSPTEVKAWIVPLSDERALLTFSSVSPPAAPRHLVREVRLQQGFDELGLERLASITHSAFVALSEGVEGLEREQAERELGRAGVAARSATAANEAAPPAAPLASPLPVPAPMTSNAEPGRAAAVAPRPAASLLLAAGYGVRLRGVEGVGHGPSLALGVQLPGTRTAYDLALSGHYLFRTEFQADPFIASVQTTALRVQLGIEPRLGAALFGQVLLGLGADLARISASAQSSSSELLPRANGTQWRGAGELTLGLLRRGALLDLGVCAQATLMFEDVRYDATTNTGDMLLARPWRIQPALSLQGRFRSAL